MAAHRSRAGFAVPSSGLMALVVVLLLAGWSQAAVYYDSSLDFPAGSSDNIALNKPTSMKNFEVDDDGAAGYDHSSRAVDGNTELRGDGCVETDESSNPWVTVDLGADVDIRYVKIYNFVHPDNWWQRNLEGGQGFGILTATSAAPDAWTVTEGFDEEGDVSAKRYMNGATTLFRVDSFARYLRVKYNGWGTLRLCEIQAFSTEPTMSYSVPQMVIDAAAQQVEVACPDEGHPLHAGCTAYSDPEGDHKLSPEMALVKVMHEGPITCGTGFFCRMKGDEYFTGTPGDNLRANYNSGYCEDLEGENPDGAFPGNFRNPERDDMHCHGSHLDSVYDAVLEDHYHRVYRGTLECCCGEHMTDHEAPEGNPSDRDGWVPASKLMHRCDFRGANGNDNNYNFDGGCGGDVLSDDFIDPELFLSPADFSAQNTCWEMKHFGRQPTFHSGPNAMAVTTDTPLASPPYPEPSLDILHCSGDAEGWEGCLLMVTGRPMANLMVLVSSDATDEPRTIGRIDSWSDTVSSCSYVSGVHVTGKDLKYYHLHELDVNGVEAQYVLSPDYEVGSPVHVQLLDTATCATSVPKSGVLGEGARKRLSRHRAVL